jgi:hypothetical protein
LQLDVSFGGVGHPGCVSARGIARWNFVSRLPETTLVANSDVKSTMAASVAVRIGEVGVNTEETARTRWSLQTHVPSPDLEAAGTDRVSPGGPRGAFGDDCALCAVAQQGGALARVDVAGMVVAYLDDQVVGLIEPGAPGVLVAPRSHMRELSTMPAHTGAVLAALRRAAQTVMSSYRTSGTMIEPTTKVPGAAGHVCYRVVPSTFDRLLPLPAPDLEAEAECLAAALGQSVG